MAKPTYRATPAAVLSSARRMYEFARQGQADYLAGGDRRLSGLFNAITMGRSVTFTLQNLKGLTPGFEEWYTQRQDTLREDPVAKWFNTLRSRIEKEGTLGEMRVSGRIVHLDSAEMMKAAPPNVIGIFIGDGLGRSGWTVELPDGSKHTIFFTVPAEVGETTFRVDDAPDHRPMDEHLSYWLDLIEQLLMDAERRFS